MDNNQPLNFGNQTPSGQSAPSQSASSQPASGQPYTGAFTQPINNPLGAAPTSQPQNGLPQTQMATPMQMPNVEQNPITGAPMIMQAPPLPPKKDAKSLIKTIAIIALSLVSVTFIGLFIWMFVQYDAAHTEVQSQIDSAVAVAVDENTTKLESEFAIREQYPYRTFAGPVDYGELTFEYPKTWAVYIAQDAANGGNFEAYFNPIEVAAISNANIYSLRLFIRDQSFDSIIASYQGEIVGEEPRMQLDLIQIGREGSTIAANRYTGLIPGTEFTGYVVVFKIRDKTVILQTDSMLFEEQFNNILSSIQFNA